MKYCFWFCFLLISNPFTALSQSAKLEQEVDSLNNLGWRIRSEDYQKANGFILQAIDKAKGAGYKKGEGKGYNLLGILCRRRSFYAEAEDYFLMALKIREDLKDSLGISSVYTNLANTKRDQGKLVEAINYGIKAIEYSEPHKIEAPGDVGMAYMNLGITYSRNKDLNKSQEFYNLALSIFEEQKDSIQIGRAKYNFAIQYYQEEYLDEAEKLFIEAAEIFKNLKSFTYQASIYEALGNVYVKKKEFESGEDFFLKSIAINDLLGDSSRLLINYYNLGDLFKTKKSFSKALQYTHKAKSYLTDHGLLYEQWLLADQFSSIYEKLGKMDAAFQYKTQAYVLNDSIFNIKKSKQITEQQTRFETEKFKRENAEKSIDIQQKTYQRNIFLATACSLLLLFIGGLFYYFYRQRLNKIIISQKDKIHQQQFDDLLKSQELRFVNARLNGQELERERLAKELHDRIGSMMVSTMWQYKTLQDTKEEQGEDVSPLRKANAQFEKTYEELRQVSYNIGSGNIKRIGLVQAVNDLCDTLTGTGKIEAKFTAHGIPDFLEEKIEIPVYRSIQELVSNVLKHAKATKLDIQLNYIEQELLLMVEDNGIGFDPLSTDYKGMGLKNIEARIQQLNGTFDIDSGKGGGTTITILIPTEMVAKNLL